MRQIVSFSSTEEEGSCSPSLDKLLGRERFCWSFLWGLQSISPASERHKHLLVPDCSCVVIRETSVLCFPLIGKWEYCRGQGTVGFLSSDWQFTPVGASASFTASFCRPTGMSFHNSLFLLFLWLRRKMESLFQLQMIRSQFRVPVQPFRMSPIGHPLCLPWDSDGLWPIFPGKCTKRGRVGRHMLRNWLVMGFSNFFMSQG